MKYILISMLSLAALISCTKGGNYKSLEGATYVINSALDGSKVSPATTSDTTKGALTGWYDEDANDFNFTLTYKKDTSIIKLDTLTGVQFFNGAPSATATAVRTVTVVTTIMATGVVNVSGSFTRGFGGNNAITAEELPNFINGKWYVVLTSAKFPSGVIAGQLSVSKN